MSLAAEAFDIAEVKRASVRFKGALQAEWQETIKAARDGQSLTAPPAQLTMSPATRALPTVNFALKYSSHQVSSADSAERSPLHVANWSC